MIKSFLDNKKYPTDTIESINRRQTNAT